MTDILIETFRSAVLAGLMWFLWDAGQKWQGGEKAGWPAVLAGFALLLFGSVIDITDNFPELNALVVVGDTPVQAFLEKIVGYLGGVVLLAAGLAKWIPSLRDSSEALDKARAEAEHGRALLSDAIESMHDGFALFDSDDRLTLCNARFREDLPVVEGTIAPGHTFEEVIRAFAPLIVGWSGAAREAWIRERLAWHWTHDPSEAFEVSLGDGRAWVVREHSTWEGGCVLIRTEVTQLRQVEAALKGSEEELRRSKRRLKGIVESAADGIFVHDMQGRFLQVNQAACDSVGYTREELCRMSVTDLVTDQDPSVLRRIWKTLEPGRPVTIEANHRRRDGSSLPIEVRIQLLDEADHRLVVAVARDMTAHKLSQEALSRAETHLKDAIESLQDGFVLWDLRDKLVLSNGAFRDMFPGIAEDIVPGLHFQDFVDRLTMGGQIAPGNQTIAAWREGRLARRAECEGAFELSLADGRILLARERRTRDGGAVCILTDISAVKEAERRILRSAQQAGMANRAKSEFLATMSHELRTPLNAVIGFSEVALTEIYGPLADEYREYYRHIRDSGHHLLEIIEDILDVSQIEGDTMTLNEQEVDVPSVVKLALHNVSKRAEAGRKALQEKIHAGLPRVYGDPRRLRQILTNLLSNAVKFTPEGGKVTVDASLDSDGALVFRVSDTGVGMAPEDIPRAMAPFSQLESGLDRHHDGTGLGLYLADKLVQLHDGTLRLESKRDQGTTVSVRIPPQRMRTH